METNVKVSVIIPMYNAEPFIRLCITSVVRQTWRDLEILVVDDGSTDRSVELCREIGRSDDRIRVLNQEHGGVSAARNRGLEAAAGEYVFFLDSDDGIHPRLLEQMVKAARKWDADLVFCHYARVADEKMDGVLEAGEDNCGKAHTVTGYGRRPYFRTKRTGEIHKGRKRTGINGERERHERGKRGREEELSGSEKKTTGRLHVGETWGSGQLYVRETWRGTCETLGAWESGETEAWFHVRYQADLSGIGGKLIRRRFIGNERFDETISRGEDTVFLYRLCSGNIRMALWDRPWYYYRVHESSLSHRNQRMQDRGSFKAYEIIRDQEYKKGDSPWAGEWEYRFVWAILSGYLIAKNAGDKKGSLRLKKRMLEEMRHPLYREFSAGRKLFFSGLFFGCSRVPAVRWLWGVKRQRAETAITN